MSGTSAKTPEKTGTQTTTNTAGRASGSTPRGARLRRDSRATQIRLLNAAEQLFAEHGYRGVSVRAIADMAGVNVAAAHYHFGSKSALLAAAIARHVEPINAARIARLDALEQDGRVPGVTAILDAFLTPVFELENRALPRLMARLFAEPARLSRPVIQQLMGAIAQRFLAALGRALPAVSEEVLHWRFHFAVGAMVHTLNIGTPFGLDDGDGAEPSRIAPAAMGCLRAFMAAGLQAPDASGTVVNQPEPGGSFI